MSATILQFPSPSMTLCAGLPRETVVAPDWDGKWRPYGEVEVNLFEETGPGPDGGQPTFALVATEDRRLLSALVTHEKPGWDDVERLLSWLDFPEGSVGLLEGVDDPQVMRESAVLNCATRWGVSCGCQTCDATPTSEFTVRAAETALAFVAMNGGPSPRVNWRLMALMPLWVQITNPAQSA